MALGIIERCLELSVEHARNRVQFGSGSGTSSSSSTRLAFMEVARLNVENLVLDHIDRVDSGAKPSLFEASAMKLYAAGEALRVALDAVQVLGGQGYMSESHVEQLARDAKVLQIYGGTDEIQITQVARGLLGPG
jgi:alkylation response protein AidB-like acyl-CoA dehydrogenase